MPTAACPPPPNEPQRSVDIEAIGVEGLSVFARTPVAERCLLKPLSLRWHVHERLGIVGASGSGKTTLLLACMGLLPRTHYRIEGTLWLEPRTGSARRVLPWHAPHPEVFAPLFQDPSSSLNPHLRLRAQLLDGLPNTAPHRMRIEQALCMWRAVGLPGGAQRLREYPHTLSGGMQQRAALCAALLSPARVIVADEPTTALDAQMQREVLGTLLSLCERHGRGLIAITHDLAVLAPLATRVIVLHEGGLIEDTPAATFFRRPAHPVAQAMLAQAHRVAQPMARNCPSVPSENTEAAPAPVLEAVGIGVTAWPASRWPWTRKQRRPAALLADIDLALPAGQAVALLGESGSGKTTLGRVLCGARIPSQGAVHATAAARWPHGVQRLAQHAKTSFDPSQRMGEAIDEALRLAPPGQRPPGGRQALWAQVGLPPELLAARPHALSGGQAQRAAVARALAVAPAALVADEPTSGLDGASRQQILALLFGLCDAQRLALLLITHDLAAAQSADRVAVMYLGRIVEEGPAAELFAQPRHPYTQALLAARLTLSPTNEQNAPAAEQAAPPEASEPTSVWALPSGCAFHPRCPRAAGRCRRERPTLRALVPGHQAACHYA